MNETRTIPVVLREAVRQWGRSPALRFRAGGAWTTLTWNEYGERAQSVARALIELGLRPGRGVSILASNAPEWFIADIATILAGGVPTGHYVTSSPEQIEYIARDSEAQIAVVDTEEQLAKIEAIRDSLPLLEAIVVTRSGARGRNVYTWEQLLDIGRRSSTQSELDRRAERQAPNDVATLIYTSGTTGVPKGVELTHRNLVWTAGAIVADLGMKTGDRLISYLPLSHIAEQIFTLHSPLQGGACTTFVDNLADLPDAMRATRPTLFFAVPRVWEKIGAKVTEAAAAMPPLKKKIAGWARAVGLAAGSAGERGEAPPLSHHLADRLVFRKVRHKLGLDEARMCFTSAAPIARETLDLFFGLGIPIYEVFGMSECTGPATFSRPGDYRIGKTGKAASNTELRIAPDGEVLIRGLHVFRGYHKDPDSPPAIDEEGWLHSGDVGEIDEDGFLTITGRKKDIIITSGGHNVAPQAIEQELRGIQPVSQAVVVGDGRSYLVALLTLQEEMLPTVAASLGSAARDAESAASCRFFNEYLGRRMDELGRRFARSETPKKFAILPNDFSIDGGELTPTMKVRRTVVQEKYRNVIEGLYRGE
ncbi:MAG: AMP-dependent synthetase/ligase [Thermoanaerobaculia bacterium]